ncbi:MAG: mercuric transporter MerT family protein [Candidatus Bipolaricaulia bacterium]
MSRQDPSNTGTNWSIGAALGAALGASACCTIPLALVSLGIGGAWIGSLTALAPYRWIFVPLAVGALGYAGYNEWQLSRRPDCDCETAFSSTTRRSLLGLVALAVLGLVVSPWLIAPSPSAATQRARAAAQKAPAQNAGTPASFRQVVLTVEGMTCKACPITVRKALTQVEGVYSATTSYKPPEAIVRFDPAKTSVKALTRATTKAGYPSSLKSTS